MKKKIIATIITIAMLCTCLITSVSATGLDEASNIRVKLDTNGESSFDFVVDVTLKSADGVGLRALLNSGMHWETTLEGTINTTYDVVIEYGNEENNNWDVVSTETGKTITTYTPKTAESSLLLRLVRKGATGEAKKANAEIMAEGKALFDDYMTKVKPIFDDPKYIDSRKYYGDDKLGKWNDKNDIGRHYQRFLGTAPSDLEMWKTMSNVERSEYCDLVGSPLAYIVTNRLTDRNSYLDRVKMPHDKYLDTTVSEEVNLAASKARRDLLMWLWDTHAKTGVFVNVFEFDNNALSMPDAEPTIDLTVDSTGETITPTKENDVDKKAPTATAVEVKKENGFVKFLKGNWFTLAIVLGAGVAFLIVRQKRKKKAIDE